MNVEIATWNTEVLAMQNGTEIVTGADITYYDLITKPDAGWANGAAHLSRALKTGTEVKYLYAVDEDGTYSKTYEQANAAAAGKFVIGADNTITFNSGDEPTTNYVACAYTSPATTSQKITIEAGGVPPTVLVTAYGIAKDVCNGERFPCTIEGLAQVDGNWNFDVAADGDPAAQGFSLEFVRNCNTKELYSFTVFDDEE